MKDNLMKVAGAVLVVVAVLAIVNRAKVSFPWLGKVIAQ